MRNIGLRHIILLYERHINNIDLHPIYVILCSDVPFIDGNLASTSKLKVSKRQFILSTYIFKIVYIQVPYS